MCQRRAVGWHHHVPRDRRAHDNGVRCAGTICDELKVVDPPVQRQIVLEMDTLTPETYRRDYLATGRPVVLRNFVDEEARYLGTRDRFV